MKTKTQKKSSAIGIVLLAYLLLHLSFLLLIIYISKQFSAFSQVHILIEALDIMIIPLVFAVPTIMYFKLTNPYQKLKISRIFSPITVPVYRKTAANSTVFFESDTSATDEKNAVQKSSGTGDEQKINFAFASAVLLTVVILVGYLSDFLISLSGVYVISGAVESGVTLMILSFVSTVLLPCFFEEIFCRGVVLREFLRLGERRAVILSALVFALIHYNFKQFLYAFAAGLIIGYCVVKTRSLRFGIALHFVNNATSFFMNAVVKNLPKNAADVALIAVFAAIAALDVAMLVSLIRRRNWRFYLLKNASERNAVFSKELLIYFILSFILLIYSFHSYI